MLGLRGRRTSILLFVITDKLCWPGRQVFGRACRTSTPCRPRCEVPLPGSSASRGRLCGATDEAATFVLTLVRLGWSAQSARHLTTPRRHDYRSAIGGSEDCGFLGPPGFAGVVRQLCTLGQFNRATFLGCNQAACRFRQAGGGGHFGIATCWSSWFRVALRHKNRLSRLRGWEDDRCQLCHEGPDTMFHRCCECPALRTERDRHVSQEVGQAARSLAPQHREQFENDISHCLSTMLPTGSLQQSCATRGDRTSEHCPCHWSFLHSCQTTSLS